MSDVYQYHNSDTEDVGNRVLVFATAKINYSTFGLTDFARKNYGALLSRPQGFSQNQTTLRGSYAINVANEQKHALRTMDILRNVDQFLDYSITAKHLTFHITDFTKQIKRARPAIVARLFVGAHNNCIFPQEWKQWIEPPPYVV